MNALIPIITQSGLRAVFNADNDGLQAKISHIAFGNQAYTPTGTETALQNEQARIPISGGKWVGDYTIHLAALLDSGPSFWIKEVGIVLEDGTILAVWSDPDTPLAYKTSGVPIVTAFDLSLEALPADAITVDAGDIDLVLFFASEFAQMGTAIINSMSHIATLADRITAAEKTIDRLSGNTAAQAAAIDRIN